VTVVAPADAEVSRHMLIGLAMVAAKICVKFCGEPSFVAMPLGVPFPSVSPYAQATTQSPFPRLPEVIVATRDV
jgi:hypothetical protein